MSAILKYSSHMTPLEMECDNLRDAMIAGYTLLNRGYGHPNCIIEGETKYAFEEMEKYWEEHSFEDLEL